ncbi:MTERF5 [Symbiodinium sp. CCMP2592]|nr:MTERF5 [Symbiodinium sp. CCMP2592]
MPGIFQDLQPCLDQGKKAHEEIQKKHGPDSAAKIEGHCTFVWDWVREEMPLENDEGTALEESVREIVANSCCQYACRILQGLSVITRHAVSGVHRSVAEVELLSHLAVLLAPHQPIAELFRDFCVEPSENWASSRLSPDLAVPGVLTKKEAVLFVEYDGYYRHQLPSGIVADERKNAALLQYAPAGSRIVRVAHAERNVSGGDDRAAEVVVSTWQPGHQAGCVDLEPARSFVQEVILSSGGGTRESRRARVLAFLEKNIALPEAVAEKALQKFTTLLGHSIEAKLKPTVEWLHVVGLSKVQVSKAIATHPQLLGYSIAANLKPTVEWLHEVGLSKGQVSKVIASFAPLLGYSIEANLIPTVEWLHEVGLSKVQVSKAIAIHPQLLGYSIEAKLKPTVEWLHVVGLSKVQVSKAIATHPQLLGYSIAANLKPTVEWLHEVGLSKGQVSKVIASFAPLLGYSIAANLKPTVEWLHEVGLSKGQVSKVIASFAPLLGYSIEANLKPTEWLHEVGLSKVQVSKAIAIHPQLLGYSIEAKLKPTVEWLHVVGLSKVQVSKAIATHPQLLGYSIAANLKPTVEWLHEVGLSKGQVSKVQVSRAIATFPQLVGLSIQKNLVPKLPAPKVEITPVETEDVGTKKVITKPPRLLTQDPEDCETLLSKGKYDLLVVGCPLDPPKSNSTADVIAQQSAVDKFLFLLLQSMMKHEGCVQRLAVLTHDTFTVEEAAHKQRGLSIVSGATIFGMMNTARQELGIPIQVNTVRQCWPYPIYRGIRHDRPHGRFVYRQFLSREYETKASKPWAVTLVLGFSNGSRLEAAPTL